VLAAEEHAVRHDRIDPAVFLERAFLEVGHVNDASVVYQNVEAAETASDLANDRGPGFFRSDIVRERHRGTADPARHRLRCAEVDIAHDHGCAFAREQFTIRRTKPRSAAGHQRDLAVHPSHRSLH